MPLVVLNHVGGHLHGRIENHPVGNLLGEGRIDAARPLVQVVPLAAAGRISRIFEEDVECAGRVVHRTAQQAREGEHHRMRRGIAVAPGVPLHAAGPLARHHVGPRTADAAILDGLVGVDRHAVARRRLDHLLVVAHAVLAGETAGVARLEVVHPVVRIPGHRLLELPFVVGDVAARLVVADDFDAPLGGIARHLIHVEVGIGPREVERLAAAPALPAFVPPLEQHPLDVVRRGEVDVALGILGRGAVAFVHRPALDPEVHAPPDADVLHRTNPARVLDFAGFVQVENQPRINQPHRLVGQLHRTPRRREAARRAGLRAVGQRSQLRLEAERRGAQQRHLGEVVERRLVDAAVVPPHVEGGRRIGIGQLAERQMAVKQFVGLEVGRYGPRVAVGGKAELGPLVGNGERIGVGDFVFVAEADAVVEEAEAHREPRAGVVRQADGHLVAVVAHLLVLAPGLAPLLVDGAALDAADAEARIEHCLAAPEAEGRGKQQLLTVGKQRVAHAPAGIERKAEFIAPVGRAERGIRRAGGKEQCRRQWKQKGNDSFHGVAVTVFGVWRSRLKERPEAC